MLIAPKIGQQNLMIADCVRPYIHEVFEIQLNGIDLNKSFNDCKLIIESVKPVSEVILHMPFSLHVIEVFLMSDKLREKINLFIRKLVKYSNNTGIKIGVLFHSEINIEFFKVVSGYRYFEALIELVNNSNVYYLIENALPEINGKYCDEVPAFEMLKIVDSDKVKMCLDICHLQASENLVKSKIEIDPIIINKIHEIHFSATLNNDGCIDKHNTHGKLHESYEDLKIDFKRLVDSGINLNGLIVIAEISEEDYDLRSNMIKELDMLNKANGEYLNW